MTDYFAFSEEHAEVHGAGEVHHDGEGAHHGGHHHST